MNRYYDLPYIQVHDPVKKGLPNHSQLRSFGKTQRISQISIDLVHSKRLFSKVSFGTNVLIPKVNTSQLFFWSKKGLYKFINITVHLFLYSLRFNTFFVCLPLVFTKWSKCFRIIWFNNTQRLPSSLFCFSEEYRFFYLYFRSHHKVCFKY